eukprot:3004572-Prymnesium_polylepis.2
MGRAAFAQARNMQREKGEPKWQIVAEGTAAGSGRPVEEQRLLERWRVVRAIPGGLLVKCCVCRRHCRVDGVLVRQGGNAAAPMCKQCCDAVVADGVSVTGQNGWRMG